MTLGMRIRESSGVRIYLMQPKDGTVGVVGEPVATGFRVLVYFEEQVRGRRKMDIFLGGKIPKHCEADFQLFRNTRICNVSLCDDRNPIFRGIVRVAFAFWVNGYVPPLRSIGRPLVRMSPRRSAQRHRKLDAR
jgi:hypothetical protein